LPKYGRTSFVVLPFLFGEVLSFRQTHCLSILIAILIQRIEILFPAPGETPPYIESKLFSSPHILCQEHIGLYAGCKKVISDNENSRLSTIRIPEINNIKKVLIPFKSLIKRRDLDGYGPAGKEVI